MASNTPYDATTRVLLSIHPQDWLAFLGLPSDVPVEAVDTDLSTVSAAADGVLRIGGASPFALHLEFESGHTGRRLPKRLPRYNVLVSDTLDLPTRSVAFLLKPEADSPGLTGTFTQALPDGATYLTFTYVVVRVWEIPPQQLLNAGLSVLPLVPLARVSEEALPEVLARMDQRIEIAKVNQEITSDAAQELWTATYVLMGIKYQSELITKLMRGVMQMRESSTYQLIIAEGRAEGRAEGIAEGQATAQTVLRKLIRHTGDRRYGQPSLEVNTVLDSISLERLERMAERLYEVETWDELLATE